MLKAVALLDLGILNFSIAGNDKRGPPLERSFIKRFKQTKATE